MIGHGKRQAHQLQHRFQQAFGLAQPQAKHQAQRQGGLDCQIGINGAGRRASCVLVPATWTGLPVSPTMSNCRADEVQPHTPASSRP